MTARELSVDQSALNESSVGQRVSGNPATSFDDLYRVERAAMRRLAFLLVDSVSVADEITHDAFVKVLERWDRLDRPGAYLRTCVINGARQVLRRRRLERRLPGSRVDDVDLGADHMISALGGLSARRRAVLVLRYYEDLPVDEIAMILGIRSGTVKSALNRALTELRETIEKDV